MSRASSNETEMRAKDPSRDSLATSKSLAWLTQQHGCTAHIGFDRGVTDWLPLSSPLSLSHRNEVARSSSRSIARVEKRGLWAAVVRRCLQLRGAYWLPKTTCTAQPHLSPTRLGMRESRSSENACGCKHLCWGTQIACFRQILGCTGAEKIDSAKAPGWERAHAWAYLDTLAHH